MDIGSGPGYGGGSGPGDGFGYGSGYGGGYGGGSGDGYGSGDGDGFGSGSGYGDGSGSGYGDGSGYGSGSSDTSSTYWQAVVPAQVTDKMLLVENADLRRVILACYGVDRFLAGGRVLDQRGEYVLVERNLNGFLMRAVKMVCPSTGAVYVSPIPRECQTVSDALNWKYLIPPGLDYFDLVKIET